MFKGRKFSPVPFSSAAELEKSYQLRLLECIDKKALEFAGQVLHFIESQQGKLEKAKWIVDRLGSYKETKSARRGNIGFTKLSSNMYQVYVDISPYIMDIHGKYYAFQRVKVGMDLNVARNHMQLTNSPIVLTSNYHHPFVFSGGGICYDGQNRWIDQGIQFNHPYPLENSVDLARKISYALGQAKLSLRKGYRNRNIGPVNSLSEFKPIAANRNRAERYAAQHNIPLERIIKNY